MEIKNVNIIQINKVFNSAIQQSTDGSTINLPINEAENVVDFLTSIDTDVELRKIENAYIRGLNNAENLAKRYFQTLISEVEKYRIEDAAPLGRHIDNPWGDRIIEEIDKMIPLRNKILSFFVGVYENSSATAFLHDCLKQILQTSYDHFETFNYAGSWGYGKTDHIRKFVYEIFLYISAYLCKNERIEDWSNLLNTSYQMLCVVGRNSTHPEKDYRSVPFSHFNQFILTIDHEHRRAKQGAFYTNSLYSEQIASDYKGIPFVTINELVNTDILLYFISLFAIAKGKDDHIWIPYTCSFRKDVVSDFMLKCESDTFFAKALKIFGCKDVADFTKTVGQVSNLRLKNDHILAERNLQNIDFALYKHPTKIR